MNKRLQEAIARRETREREEEMNKVKIDEITEEKMLEIGFKKEEGKQRYSKKAIEKDQKKLNYIYEYKNNEEQVIDTEEYGGVYLEEHEIGRMKMGIYSSDLKSIYRYFGVTLDGEQINITFKDIITRGIQLTPEDWEKAVATYEKELSSYIQSVSERGG